MDENKKYLRGASTALISATVALALVGMGMVALGDGRADPLLVLIPGLLFLVNAWYNKQICVRRYNGIELAIKAWRVSSAVCVILVLVSFGLFIFSKGFDGRMLLSLILSLQGPVLFAVLERFAPED